VTGWKDAPVSPPPADVVDQHAVGIAEVSKLLGVPMPTLRSWERRYNMPATAARVPGTHRRYTTNELHSLRLMRDEIARGKPARVAAATVRQLLGASGPAVGFVNDILHAAASSEPGAVHAALRQAHELLGLAPCLDDVLLPAMQQVGIWWATGRCDMDQEHLTTEAARAWLESLVAHAPTPSRANPIVLACGPTDMHTIGLEALTVLLRYHGRACRLLGARTPADAVVTAVHASAADAVVIVSHLGSGRHRAIETLHAATRTGSAVFYAGNAFSSPRSRRNAPGTYLGVRLEGACQLIGAELQSRRASATG
jgi:MerR family transcriptional regulator, light-induced transcriptional regulator